MGPDQQDWTVPRIVAFNMRRLRTHRNWTQARAAKAISERLTESWSEKTYSNAEGTRPRLFTAGELIAIALAFDVQLIELFRPPEALPPGDLSEQLDALEHLDAQRSSVTPTNSEEAIRLALLQLSEDQMQAAYNAKKIADHFKRL